MSKYYDKQRLTNILPCLCYGVWCGALTGLAVFAFKWLAQVLERLSRMLYAEAAKHPVYLVAVFAALVLLALAMLWLHKKIPEARGGGIPRSEGVLRGILRFRWLKTLLGTVLGSSISFVCGLPLGSEGPAVLFGTSLGAMCGHTSKNSMAWNRYVMTGGAGSGFAVATGAPLSGILFALEEIHKRFTPMLVLTTSVAVLSATYINRLLCSLFNVNADLFSVGSIATFELKHSAYLLALGVIVALAVGVFDWLGAVFDRFSQKHSRILSAPIKLILVFVLTGVLALTLTDGVYSGHHMILEVLEDHHELWFLLLLLTVRYVMMHLMIDSGATGGIFIPTLAIGALTSALIAKLLVACGMPETLFSAIVLLGMCAFIGGTLRAPLTASVLFLELTGQFVNLFYVVLVIFVTYLATELINQLPLYDRALEHMERAQNGDKQPTIAHFEAKISSGAFAVGKAVRDIMWPPSTVLIGITRADEKQADMDNDGEKRLYAGDTIVVRARYYDEEELRHLLAAIVGQEHPIQKVKKA